MSEAAAARARGLYGQDEGGILLLDRGAAIRRHKPAEKRIPLPRTPSTSEIPSDYVGLVREAKLIRRQADGEREQTPTVPTTRNMQDSEDWGVLDFIAVLGAVLLFAGFLAALFSQSRPLGILFPIGAGMMALSAYASRGNDDNEE